MRVAKDEAERQEIWRLRREMSFSLRTVASLKFNHDVVVPKGRIPELFALIAHLRNPRAERESHYYNCVNTNLRSLGLEPTFLTEETIAGLIALAAAHRERVDLGLIAPRVSWRPETQRTSISAAS